MNKILRSVCLVCIGCFTVVSASVYEIGPSKTYSNINDYAWETLAAGDTVKIHYRSTPYAEKWVLCCQGTEESPIVVQGIADPSGILPKIDGREATTRDELNFWSETRGVIKVGGANTPSDRMPRHIIIENLDIQGARPPFSFTGRDGLTDYDTNASAIYVEKGEHITVRNCILHNCGNGFFCSHESYDILVEYCKIYDNGIEESIYEHNNYTEAHGITFQFNYFGPLRENCSGNNLKDRSSGCVIRYNWIESGNRQLDLVDSDYSSIYGAAEYSSTFVYGNVLIEPADAGNSQICHYGGDSGNENQYRKGTLYFYNNTVVSTCTGNTTLFRLSSDDETCDCRNNILYVTESGNRLAVTDDAGIVNLYSNWLGENWRASHSNLSADVNAVSGNLTGSNPGFFDPDSDSYSLLSGSSCINQDGALADSARSAYPVTMQYRPHARSMSRYEDSQLDIGAYEYEPGGSIRDPCVYGEKTELPFKIITNPFSSEVTVYYELFQTSGISIQWYNVLGRQILSSGEQIQPSGMYSRTFCFKRFPQGVYCCRVRYGNKQTAQKTVFLR